MFLTIFLVQLLSFAKPPVTDLSDSIRAAAAAIPDDYAVEFPKVYNRPAEPGHRQRATLYLQALRAGHPIVMSRSPHSQAITRQLVLRLDKASCEAWLRTALEIASDEPRRKAFNDHLGVPVAMARKDVAVAVWNLSSDPNLRMDAKNFWDTVQSEAAKSYDRSRAKARNSSTHQMVRDAGAYRPEPMPAWLLPENERCADREQDPSNGD